MDLKKKKPLQRAGTALVARLQIRQWWSLTVWLQAEVDRILGTREPMEAPKVEPVAKVEAPPVVQEEVKQTGFLVMQKEDSSKVYGFSNV